MQGPTKTNEHTQEIQTSNTPIDRSYCTQSPPKQNQSGGLAVVSILSPGRGDNRTLPRQMSGVLLSKTKSL